MREMKYVMQMLHRASNKESQSESTPPCRLPQHYSPFNYWQ